MSNMSKGNLKTDKNTDYLFRYFMNEDKLNEQLRTELDREMDEKIKANKNFRLDTRIGTERNKSVTKKPNINGGNVNNANGANNNSSEETELPSNSENSDKPNVDFNDSDSDSSNQDSVTASDGFNGSKSPYKNKINAVPGSILPVNTFGQFPGLNQNFQQDSGQNFNQSPVARNTYTAPQPALGDRLIGDIEKYIETPEEKRARAREAYAKLEELVENYSVQLSRTYTIDDDPNELEAEYQMQKDKRSKKTQVQFYKQILLNIVCGAEYLNETYDPFKIKLKDWSKQMASDMDNYTEVLGEIYEKYRDRGGKMAPEIKLLFMIIMSGVTFHLSQKLFGQGGLSDVVGNNPNVINQLLGGLMKGGMGNMLGGDEPVEAKVTPKNNKSILEAIKKYNNKGTSESKSESRSDYKSESVNSVSTEKSDKQSETIKKITEANEIVAKERERRLMAEQRAEMEAQLRRQSEQHAAEMEQMRNQYLNSIGQLSTTRPVDNYSQPSINDNYVNTPTKINNSVNLVLSDATKKPRFLNNQKVANSPIISNKPLNTRDIGFGDFFGNETDMNKESSKKSGRLNIGGFDNLDSLDSTNSIDSEDDDIVSDINDFFASNKPTKSPKQPVSATKSTTKKRPNSITRSATKSVGRKKGTETSDLITPRKPKIIDL
ncbi:hypothetical protein [Acanthamoeba polyphaga mimivirus]|uniref:Uncharacterized protein n=1 Tax=Acanthamoeba polyphaga mimivirus TaxID=212035 RepID=A0A0G2Y0Q1_MIMIV|nr:hypothetical protein [Acanthamoeba castellanii mamavirus]AKI79220.1 hypothetical protein [Acanthamoeba polyphaga mimivirus]EJN40885.1 hypothetical protein lvs_R381 [Acanthamoeba polyphaga lentillevirus]UMZ08029.1 hypothetical protein [Acanthamoeba polyphaga mimivirus]